MILVKNLNLILRRTLTMGDSFMARRNKERASGAKITLVQTYSKDAGFQLTLNKTEYKDGTHDYSCSIEMCPGHSERNDSGKGFKTVCNWKDEKIVMSISADELAMFSKYQDSFFLRIGGKIDIVHHDFCAVESAERFCNFFVQNFVIGDGAFPAHSSDKSDSFHFTFQLF